MKNKEFTLIMTCYDNYGFICHVLGYRIEKVAKLIAEDLNFEFDNCDEINFEIKCSPHPNKRIFYGADCIAFMFSITTNCQNDDMTSELKDAIYNVVYEYIDGNDVEVELYDSFV